MGSTWSAGGRAVREGSKRLLSQEAVSMAAGGAVSAHKRKVFSAGTAPPSSLGKAPFVRPWGPEFRVGQEGVNGSPPPSFTCAPKSLVPQHWAPALPRLPPRAHVRLQPPHPRLVLARKTASGSTHAANSFVLHVTNDARAPAMRGGVLPEESRRQRQWCACGSLH